MQLHQVQPNHRGRRARRVGRGGKRGTYSGRGIKGQRARAGAKIRPQERDILKKIPKLRGYKFKSFRSGPAAVNLDTIDRRFREGETVTPQTLHQRGLIRKIKGRIPEVKILGRGELKKHLAFKDVSFSKSAANNLRRDPSVRSDKSVS